MTAELTPKSAFCTHFLRVKLPQGRSVVVMVSPADINCAAGQEAELVHSQDEVTLTKPLPDRVPRRPVVGAVL